MADDPGGSPRPSGEGRAYSEDLIEGEEKKLSGSEVDVRPSCHNHVVTILAIWNVTIGTSLYTMPWAMDRAGLILGIIIIIIMGAIVYYSCYRVVMHQPDASRLNCTYYEPLQCSFLPFNFRTFFDVSHIGM
jgi:hypothetical protein